MRMRDIMPREIAALIVAVIAIMMTIIMCSAKLATPANTKKRACIPKHIDAYVKRFLPTARAEAEKYNIPVSIKLAQGIIESNAGKSELSSKYNNHFGIKWRGVGKYVVYKDDTPKDRFQVFKSAWRSYRAHSELLCLPRYNHLRKLKRTEYKKWAYGLKRAGYATAPHYAKTLIKVIEKYKLDRYDKSYLLWR